MTDKKLQDLILWLHAHGMTKDERAIVVAMLQKHKEYNESMSVEDLGNLCFKCFNSAQYQEEKRKARKVPRMAEFDSIPGWRLVYFSADTDDSVEVRYERGD